MIAAVESLAVKDLLQMFALLLSIVGVVWFLGRRLASIETLLATVVEKQTGQGVTLSKLEEQQVIQQRRDHEMSERLLVVELNCKAEHAERKANRHDQ